jgi:predicted CXXCH cytochrome family protein
MKHVFTIVVALGLLVPSAFAQYSAVGKVLNSKHDLSSGSTSGNIKSTDQTQVCVFCHVAHQASAANKQEPLWNHTLTATNFSTAYASSTFTALGTGITAIGQGTAGTATTSHLCLSCHDGTVAVNSLYKFTATIPDSGDLVGGKLTGIGSLGTDLSSSHPVNFSMDQTTWTKTNPHIVTINTTTHATTGAVSLPLDSNNKLQCASCHTSHDNTNTNFLRDSLTGSAICIDCHLST